MNGLKRDFSDYNGSNIDTEVKYYGFDIASIFMAVISVICFVYAFRISAWPLMFTGTVAAIASMYFLIWPELIRRQMVEKRALHDSAEQLRILNEDFVQFREQFRNSLKEAGVKVGDSGGKPNEPDAEMKKLLEDAVAQIGTKRKLEDQLMELRQDYAVLNEHVEKWVEVAIEFIEFIDRTLSFEGLDEGYAEGFQKVRKEFIRKLGILGISEIAPKDGDEFDDRIHRIETTVRDNSMKPGTIVKVRSVGFMNGRRVIRPALVHITPLE